VTQTGQQTHDDGKDIRFKECRPISLHLQAKDKLDFAVASLGIQGTFEIGELPATDAQLLLVVQRRDATSSLMGFQSFAFPTRSTGDSAQLAVIDAYKGNSSSPHLRMEDHVATKERKTVSKRVEQLSFNRVYAIEEGTYDASIADHVLDQREAENQVAKRAKRELNLKKNHNYVVLRTGDAQFLDQALVVFPESTPSSAWRISISLFIAWCCLAGLAF
jgi:hypothetical protein